MKEYVINCKRTKDSVFLKREGLDDVKYIDCPYYTLNGFTGKYYCANTFLGRDCIQEKRKYGEVRIKK